MGLKGNDIPTASRIVAVVDAFGAMTTRRSYKDALTEEYAREELHRFAGTQFDPEVVAAFLKILDSPEAKAVDPEEVTACGILPGFPHAREIERRLG